MRFARLDSVTFHIPVRGYYLHGLHTFSPELLPALVELNGFELKYLEYSTPESRPVKIEDDVPDLLQWIVARRIPGPRSSSLQPVQQRLWATWWDRDPEDPR